MLAAAEAADAEEDELSAKTSAATRCRIGPATSRNGWRRSSRRWRRWRPTPGWRRRKSVASRPKRNSSAKPKAARSRANRRHRRPDEPDPKSQRNFTDPESRIMKSKDGFVQAYNAQAAVDADAQIIVAHELTQCGSDQGQLVPLIEAIENNLGRKPEEASADSGYCSEANLEALEARGIDGYVAPGRAKHPTAANGKIGGPLTQRMRKKIDDGGFEALPIEKASGGTGVRTDQTGTRLPPVPVAGRRESACRVGHDLHHPQPPEAVHPGQLSRLPCNQPPHANSLSGRAPRRSNPANIVGSGQHGALMAQRLALRDWSAMTHRLASTAVTIRRGQGGAC